MNEFAQKIAEILSQNARKTTQVNVPVPSFQATGQKYGKPATAPPPIQNKSISNFPVTHKNSPARASDPVIKSAAVSVSKMMGRLVNPKGGSKYVRGVKGKFKKKRSYRK